MNDALFKLTALESLALDENEVIYPLSCFNVEIFFLLNDFFCSW